MDIGAAPTATARIVTPRRVSRSATLRAGSRIAYRRIVLRAFGFSIGGSFKGARRAQDARSKPCHETRRIVRHELTKAHGLRGRAIAAPRTRRCAREFSALCARRVVRARRWPLKRVKRRRPLAHAWDDPMSTARSHSTPDFRLIFQSAPGCYPVLTPDLRNVSLTTPAPAQAVSRG